MKGTRLAKSMWPTQWLDCSRVGLRHVICSYWTPSLFLYQHETWATCEQQMKGAQQSSTRRGRRDDAGCNRVHMQTRERTHREFRASWMVLSGSSYQRVGDLITWCKIDGLDECSSIQRMTEERDQEGMGRTCSLKSWLSALLIHAGCAR